MPMSSLVVAVPAAADADFVLAMNLLHISMEMESAESFVSLESLAVGVGQQGSLWLLCLLQLAACCCCCCCCTSFSLSSDSDSRHFEVESKLAGRIFGEVNGGKTIFGGKFVDST